jgi:hypothetical protein
MAKKQLIAGTVGIAVVGILSYLGYRMFKEINDLDMIDFMGENVDDVYHYRTPKSGHRG